MPDIGRQMITMAIRWLPLVVLTTLAAGGIAFVYASSQKDVYEATATLRVDAGPSATTAQYDAARAALALYALDGGSRSVAQAVIDELELDAGVRDFQERVVIATDEEGLTLEISAQANDPDEARVIAQQLGNVLRQSVNGTLITEQVRAADEAIRANQRLIDSYTKRLEALRRKQPKDNDDRAEMLSLSSLIPSLRSENIRLQPSSRDSVRNRIQWVDSPRSPEASTNRPLYWTLLAMVVGGMVGAALAFVLDALRHDNRVRGIRDLEEATGLPALGSVSERRGDIKRGDPDRLIMLRYPRGETAEGYRSLVTRIGFASGPARTLMVASADTSDGRRAVAANLALAYAEAGRNVILVDADYRSPRQHSFFGVRNDRGVTNVLVDYDVPLGWVLVPTEHPKLRLVPAGPPPPRSSGPLGERQVDALVGGLLQVADMVVVDSPSIAGNLDAAVLAAHLQEAVLVVPADARADDAAEAARTLQGAEVDVVGTILYRRVRGSHKRSDAVPVAAVSPGRAPWPVPPAPPRRIPAIVTGPTPPAPGQPAGATAPGNGRYRPPPPASTNPADAAPSPPVSGPYAAPFGPGSAPSDR